MGWYEEWASAFPLAARRQEEIRQSGLPEVEQLAAFVALDREFPEAMTEWRERLARALDEKGMGPDQVQARMTAQIRARRGDDSESS